MKILPQHTFVGDPENARWLTEVNAYISAYATGSPLFPEIKAFAAAQLQTFSTASGQRSTRRAYEWPELYVSNDFFCRFSLSRGARVIPAGIVDAAFDFLETKGLVYKQYTPPNPYQQGFPEYEYRPYDELIKYLDSQDLLYNHLYGFPHIIKRYADSVLKIEVRHGADVSMGTGWYLDAQNPANPAQVRRLVVTNEHVLAGCTSFRVLTRSDVEVPYQQIELLEAVTGADLALIEVPYDAAVPSFAFNAMADVLEEVITIGYPLVPLAREAYQLVHKGEINAVVNDYFGNDLLIISARTSPGHSGSPVIDDTGRVVGMVTKELFEKYTFEQRGITPYFACTPVSVVLAALEKSRLTNIF